MKLSSSSLFWLVFCSVTSGIIVQMLYKIVYLKMTSEQFLHLMGDDILIRMEKANSFNIYHINYDLVTPDPDTVTFVSQCTPHNLHYLPALVERWGGPVSLVVFSPPLQFDITLSATYSLAMCFENVRKHVHLHIVTKDEVNVIDERSFTINLDVPCDQIIKYLKLSITGVNFHLTTTGMRYPINFLRNIGMKNAESDYVMVADIDMVTSVVFYNQTAELLMDPQFKKQLAEKTALVIPIFEMEKSVLVAPRNKRELRKGITEGFLRQFYVEVCPQCHEPLDFPRWFEIQDSIVGAIYNITYRSFWDAFLLVKKGGPLFDERFTQFGYDRISYSCELYMSGFSFSAFHPGFLVHQGFKTADSFHKNMERENEENFELFRSFHRELSEKYKEFRRVCL